MKKKITIALVVLLSIDSIAVSDTLTADNNDIKTAVSGNAVFAFAL